jgi:predicted MFS family arabinose efflux permease
VRRVLDTYRQSFSGLPRAAWVLASVSLVNRSGTMVLPFLVLYLTRELGFSRPEAGWVQGVYGMGSLAGAWIGGWLVDRVGSRRVQIASLVANGAGFFVLAMMRSHVSILVTAAAVSIVSEAFRPANAAAVAAASPPHVTSRTFALNRMAVNMGMTVGMGLGGVLAATFGYRWLFFVDGATCLLAALLLWVLRADPDAKPRRADAPAGPSPWRDGFFLLACAFIFLLALVFFQLQGTFTLYLNEIYGLREDAIGGLMAINTVLVVLLEIVIVHRLEKKEPLGIVAIGAGLVCLGFAMMPWGRSALWAVAAIVVWTAGEITSFAFLATFVTSRTTRENQGRYMALYVMSFGLAYVLAAPVGTQIYERLGPDWVWHACGLAGIVLFGAFGAMALPRRRARAAASVPADVNDERP